MNQAERTRPIWARTCTLGNASNFSRFQTIASLQLRKLGRAGVEADVAVWWPLTLRISSERYVARPERNGESAASPKLAAPAWQMPPRSGLKYAKISAVGVEGSVASFQLGARRNAPPGRRLSQLAAAWPSHASRHGRIKPRLQPSFCPVRSRLVQFAPELVLQELVKRFLVLLDLSFHRFFPFLFDFGSFGLQQLGARRRGCMVLLLCQDSQEGTNLSQTSGRPS